jgi:translation initiation factor IF-3
MSKFTALQLAKSSGFDLVEVKSGIIPICKLMDYGKFKYEKAKAEKHKQHAPSLKEIWMKYKTDSHDVSIKSNKIKELLSDGHKVTVGMKLSGRERHIPGSKERFYEIVKVLSPEIKINDIIVNDRAFSVTIHPK